MPNPNELIENMPKSFSFFNVSLNVASAPLSCPSDNKNTEVTLFATFLSLIVLTARFNPEQIFVPPLADKLLIYSLNEIMFYGETHFKPQTRSPKLSNVMIDSLSAGVNVSIRYCIVLLTKAIFSPFIEPLTSMTQIKSTLVREPPSVFNETMAGKVTSYLSLAIDRCALMEISILASFFSYLTFYTMA